MNVHFTVMPKDWLCLWFHVMLRTSRFLPIYVTVFAILSVAFFTGIYLESYILAFFCLCLAAVPVLQSGLFNALMCAFVWCMRPVVSISLEQAGIIVEAKDAKEQIPWSALANSGMLRETMNYFWLKTHPSWVFVPKRAFVMEEIDTFRQIVAAKLKDPDRDHSTSAHM